ncbi:MAG: hypothetical protein JNL82_13580 [Myxococcales bacterium]|nr:hypothetical protein [Myxococcales bacterium]
MSVRNQIAARTATLALAAVAAFAPAAAQAGNPCQSEWVKFKSFFDQNGAKIAKGVCQLINSKDAAAAQKCVSDFEAASKKINETIGRYNATAGDSSAKIGPRGLPEAVWATGTLLVERTFAGVPILSDTWRLEVQRTGGKAKNNMKGTICFLDSDGNMAMPEASFQVNPSSPNYAQTFNNVAGLTPVILLEKPAGLNGHQYQIKGTRGLEPAVVSQARAVK